MFYISCMNKTTLVVFLLLLSLPLSASELATSIASLESAWAQAYYQTSEHQQQQQYPLLLEKANNLARQYPNAAEPKIWQATILATSASLQPSLSALATLKEAKILLEEAIQLNPKALDGAAYVTLGTLYYMVPGWPISFGDPQMAEQLLKTSLHLNPNGIDANYFYGDYLLQHGRIHEAEHYFSKAVQLPIRKQQPLADSRLQQDAKLALIKTRQHQQNDHHKILSLFDNATYTGE